MSGCRRKPFEVALRASGRALCVFAAPLCIALSSVAEDLPAAIQVDRYLVQAERELKSGDYDVAVKTLDKIVALGREHGLEAPVAFWFKYAQASQQAGLHAQARESITRYLQQAGRDGVHYRAALELLDTIEVAMPGPFSVQSEPRGARIRLLDSGLLYRPGMQLAPGEYRVEASAFGYRTAVRTVRHDPRAASEHSIALRPWSGGEQFRDCPHCPEMVVIPAGSFRMGCVSEQQCSREERPVREVDVPRFAMARFEATFAQWDACLAAGGCRAYQPKDKLPQPGQFSWHPERRGLGKPNHPVFFVSWNDAKGYTRWLSRFTGQRYRLPTEAEWEYAVRAGSQTAYSWGNQKPKWSQAWADRLNWRGRTSFVGGYDRPTTVGTFQPNAWGLHNVHGNVKEWVEDCWASNYRGAPTDGSAWIADECSKRNIRGGSYHTLAEKGLRSATRRTASPTWRADDVGFRVVRELGE